MSKVGQWVFEMQQDAARMTLAQFIDLHGYAQAEVWYESNFGKGRDEPNISEEWDEYAMAEMDDGA